MGDTGNGGLGSLLQAYGFQLSAVTVATSAWTFPFSTAEVSPKPECATVDS